jgi:hypothetical protein
MYDLQPVSEQEAVYKPSWIRHYAELPANFIRSLTIDLAGTKGRESSMTGISIADTDSDGRLHVVYAEKKKLDPMEGYKWFISLIDQCIEEKRPVSIVGIESEKYGIYMTSLLDVNRVPKEKGFMLCLVPIEGVPRPVRLSSLQVPYETGKIVSNPLLKDGDYEKEIRSYYRDKIQGVDILETIFLHFKVQMIPKRMNIVRPAEIVEDAFIRQIRRDRMGADSFRQFVSRSF